MGGCASKDDEAPNLDEYFKVLMQETTSQMDDTGAAVDTKANQRKQQELHAKLRPLIERAFAHHDTNQNGVLDGDESKAFFDHYITRFAKFSKEMAHFQAQQSQRMGLAMKQAEQQMEDKDKMMDDALKDYHENETTYNQAAFSLLGKNDGKLFMDIVVDALLPGTATNFAFSNCFPTGPKHMMAKAMDQAKVSRSGG